MIRIVKRKLAVEKELLSKIEWACTFSNCEPKIRLLINYKLKKKS